MKVSIVTVNRNNAFGLKTTIDSIRNQTFRDYELIITDGGSTDNSIDIIRANTDIITDWVSERDNGIYDGMNKSLIRCHGDYVIFMNSGDSFFSPDVLNIVFSTSSDADVIYGDVSFLKIIKANPAIKSLQDFYCTSPFCHQAVFTRTSLAKQIKFDTDYKIVADWRMFYLIFAQGGIFEYKPIVIAQCDSSGISNLDVRRNNAERIKFLKTIYPNFVLTDYQELQDIKKGTLWIYYKRLENTPKLKYRILKLLTLLKI
ncbi:MAG: glycosyltransferase [Prevotella sp.]|nr:glycosyltransferase [Prevotella sp.]